MELHNQTPAVKSKSRLRKVMMILLEVVIVFIVVEAGIVFLNRYTAKPARELCVSVAVGDDFPSLQSRAENLKFEIKEIPLLTSDEKLFIFSKQPNGESQCQVYVRNNQVITKKYILYL